MARIERKLQDLLINKHNVGLANGLLEDRDSGGVRDARRDPNVAVRVFVLHGTETIEDGIGVGQFAFDQARLDHEIGILKRRDYTGD